ncbi:MAG: hydrogenase nickel incorporation protein HypB [Bauldia sp.]|nr:MAG: hydrogenase nickel incorporation protein HypB [Bauldia sp.]
MCATCGCGHGETRIDGKPAGHDHHHGGHDRHDHDQGHDHVNGNGHAHDHGHDHGGGHHSHSHAHGTSQARMVQIERDILDKNDRYADENRGFLAARRVLALNVVSSPGSGKTSLLVRTIEDLKGTLSISVIEGDQETANDAERVRATGAPAVQINTGSGCHLDAHMVGHALERLEPATGSVVFIENVGNLVCPAAFDLGETARVVVFSITEGEDKPLKYPDIFASADLVLLNKIDLLPHLDFDLEAALAAVKAVNRRAKVLAVSARTGEGLDSWYKWLAASHAREAA